MLKVSGVDKSFGDNTVLTQIDLEVEPGQVKALLGPNGAGKTTLLSIIAGLKRADSGTVTIGGHDVVSDRHEAVAKVAIAPQETGVQQILSARDNLAFCAALAGLAPAKRKQRISEVSEALSITPFLDQRCSELSGGQQRRVHAGCALVADKPLLLLDEPTVGADIAMRSQTLEAVKATAHRDTAVLYTTHYLPEVEVLGADVAVLEGGEVVFDSSLSSFLEAFAESTVVLEFSDPPDELSITIEGLTISMAAGSMYVVGAQAVQKLPTLLNRLGAASATLTGIDVLPANVESAYLQLTGRRDLGTLGTVDPAEGER